jgi:glycosyltransferase involved in cell wall biosynthesis
MMECYTAAEIFRDLGYNVDVIDFMENKINIDYGCYDVVYGFGYPLENAFYSNSAAKIKKIYYSTGACPFYSNKETVLKIMNFYKEKKKLIPESGRLLYHFWTLQIMMPDLSVILGNSSTANTYLEINPDLNFRTLPCLYYDCYDIDLSKKDFKTARKHFVWFGSGGLLHKGLDFLIDIFSKRNDIFLHICGASKAEKGFFDYYQNIIDNSENIIDHGFLDVNSADYRELMDLCAFVLFPSVSEGSAPGVISVMANGGLIPIISKASGLDVENHGYVFEDIDEKTISEHIDEALKLSDECLYEKALETKTIVREIYSHQNYKKNLREILSSFLHFL